MVYFCIAGQEHLLFHANSVLHLLSIMVWILGNEIQALPIQRDYAVVVFMTNNVRCNL